MRTLGPREAADVIRKDIELDHSGRINPEDRHQMKYVGEVCGFLGMEVNPLNLHHVALVMRDHDLEIPAVQEYPKWIDGPNGRVLVNDEEHEQRVMSAPEDHPIDAEGHDVSEDKAVDNLHRDANPAFDPKYEPGAKSNEPGAANRPSDPATRARPTSDSSTSIEPGRENDQVQVPQDNPDRTPNPQPTLDNPIPPQVPVPKGTPRRPV